jgi:predicted ATPase
VREARGQPLLETLNGFLREKSLLLVLDNFEQVLAAAPTVAELMSAESRLKVLVTSRALLRLHGEQEYPVPPLSVPDPRHLPPLSTLCQYAAVELFIQRAVNSKPEFAVSNENAPAVAAICHWLDGLPLAIELAAARMRLFSPEALLARLGSRLKLLVGGARDLPARQQALRDTIAWSYDLLSEAEQALFRRLSVFAGGFTLEAAEALGGEGDSLELLASLSEKSLVQQGEAAGDTRFKMLETIREFGQERLAETGEEVEVRQQHARFFLDLAERADPKLRGGEQLLWMERLETEHDNLRTALEWALTQEDACMGLRLGGSLFHFWATRGYITEGRGRLAGLLALAGEEGTAARARALLGEGEMAWVQGDAGLAGSLLTESLALGQALGDQRIIADALIMLGFVDRQQGDYKAARSRWEESLALGRELDDREIVAISLYLLAYLFSYQDGDYGTARSLAEEALALGRELGDRMVLAASLTALARIAIQQKSPEAARSLAAEGLVPARELGDKHLVAILLGDMGDAASDLEEYPAARASYEESLTIQREIGDRSGIASSLDRLGRVAMEEGNAEAARALYEASLALRREIGDRPGIAGSLGGLGNAAREAGEFARCAALYRESMALRQTLEDRFSIAQGLEDFAGLAGRQQRWERAVRLLGAAEGVAELVGRSLPVSVRTEYQRTVEGARKALGEAEFAAAWAEGRAMSLEEAVAEAVANAHHYEKAAE